MHLPIAQLDICVNVLAKGGEETYILLHKKRESGRCFVCASLAYFDTYRRARLPANLVQAQKDLFGAHTYERIDRPGSFHTEWKKVAHGVGALS